jgi:hypothetical protein
MRAESFGYKNAWVAVKDRRPEAVAEALSLRNVRRCDWDAGIRAAYQYPSTGSVFVTPQIDGWVLCVGFPLFGPAEGRPPAFGRLAAELADKLQSEVQYFATHRIVEAHAWARARPGGLERAYLYVGESGETLLDDGSPTADEQATLKDLTEVREQHVMALAARWSVDPSSLGERNLEVGDGLLGNFGEPPPPSPPARPHRKRWWKLS